MKRESNTKRSFGTAMARMEKLPDEVRMTDRTQAVESRVQSQRS